MDRPYFNKSLAELQQLFESHSGDDSVLEQLLHELSARKKSPAKGSRIEVAGGEFIYSFVFLDEAELFEDAQIEIQISSRRVSGTIVSIGVGRLVLALKEDIGPDVASVALLVDATALLATLKDKIEKVSKGEITLNRNLADAVVGKKACPHVEATNLPAKGGFDGGGSRESSMR